jgi:hypothetical protein
MTRSGSPLAIAIFNPTRAHHSVLLVVITEYPHQWTSCYAEIHKLKLMRLGFVEVSRPTVDSAAPGLSSGPTPGGWFGVQESLQQHT